MSVGDLMPAANFLHSWKSPLIGSGIWISGLLNSQELGGISLVL